MALLFLFEPEPEVEEAESLRLCWGVKAEAVGSPVAKDVDKDGTEEAGIVVVVGFYRKRAK